MGLFDYFEDAVDAVGDAVGDVAEAVGDVAEDVGEAVGDAAGAVVDTAGDVVGGTAAAVAGALDAGITAVDTATGGVVGEVLNVVDDVVLDSIDVVTFGVVDVDMDDGTLSAKFGMGDSLSAGGSIGRDGVRMDWEVIAGKAGGGLTDEGFDLELEGGVDIEGLPYLNLDVDVAPDGDIKASGEIQGTLPTPIGVLSGEAEGSVVRTEEETAIHLEGDGKLVTPGGTTIKGQVDTTYIDNPEGSHFSIDVAGSVTEPGVGTAGGGIVYSRTEKDGDVVETAHAEAYAQGHGVKVGAGVDYARIERDGNVLEKFEAEASAQGYGISAQAEADHMSATIDGQQHAEWETDTNVDVDLGTAVAAADEIEGSVGDLFEGVA